ESIEQLTENITDLSGGETREVVRELAHAADVAGPAYAEELTGPMARAIADGGLEQTGDDGDGGPFGIFDDANTHHSERADVGAAPGGGLFRDSLASAVASEAHASSGGRADRAMGIAGAVATSNPDLVPDDGVWTAARELGSDVVGAVSDAIDRVMEVREAA